MQFESDGEDKNEGHIDKMCPVKGQSGTTWKIPVAALWQD
jgi:hypothetical protein